MHLLSSEDERKESHMRDIEAGIDNLFDNAISVNDTVWYNEHQTLRDAILNMIEEII